MWDCVRAVVRCTFATAMSISVSLVPLTAYGQAPQDPNVAWSALWQGARAAAGRGEGAAAADFAERALATARSNFDDNDHRILISLKLAADFQERSGQFAKAAAHYREVLERLRPVVDPHDLELLVTLSNLAGTLTRLNAYDEAEKLLSEAVEGIQATFGPTHRQTIIATDNLGWLRLEQGRLEEAETMIVPAAQTALAQWGLEDPDTLTALQNLALLRIGQTRYGEAEMILRNAEQPTLRVFGAGSEGYINLHRLLASIATRHGLHATAMHHYEKILPVAERSLGIQHLLVLETLHDLASSYERNGRLGDAERLYKSALGRAREVLPEDHTQVIDLRRGLAAVLAEQDDLDEAITLYTEVQKAYQERLGAKHPASLLATNDLAIAIAKSGRHDEAAALFEAASAGARAVLGPAHRETLRFQLNQVNNLVPLQRVDEATARLRTIEEPLLTWLGAELYGTETPSLRRQAVVSQVLFQDTAIGLALLPEAPAAAMDAALAAVLHFKGLQAEEEAFLARLARRGGSEVQMLAREIAALRARLAALFHRDPEPQQIETLRQELNRKELELGRLSRAFAQFLQVRAATPDDLRASLPPRTALLEIRQYHPTDFRPGALGSPRWAGLLVMRGGAPRVVDLGPAAATAAHIDAVSRGKDPKAAEDAARDLYNLLLEPFAADLAGLDRLYLAPDGVLHLAPFARLRTPDGRYLVEAMDVRLLQTGRDLLRPSPERPAVGLLALGGIDFGPMAIVAEPQAAIERKTLASLTTLTSEKQSDSSTVRAFHRGFPSLPGSGDEADRVAWLYHAARRDEPIELRRGAEATEDWLKAKREPPRVLHLATHGFYREAEHPLDRPMLLAGVALAGANRALADATEDGVLYAIEAQDLDLEGTELVVLSACDTAQGAVDYSEGVEGLARALRTAGAQRVLVALWPLGDWSAGAFMERFYRRWLSMRDPDPANALRVAQREAIAAKIDPARWAPFVLIGG